MTDTFFKWTEEYSVGVRVLDIDHQDLFQLVNDLHRSIEQNEGQKYLTVLVQSLIKYAHEHFEREEHIMSEYKCPDLLGHQQHHQEFLRIIYAIRIVLSVQPGSISPTKLLHFLTNWLKHHVMGDDQKYAPYITAGYGRRDIDFTDPISRAKDSEDCSEMEDQIITIQVNIPVSKAQALRRCALLLRQDNDTSLDILKLVDPLSSMTEQEALTITSIALA